MTDYQAIRGTGWLFNNFTYSINADGAVYYSLTSDIDNPSNGNIQYVTQAINAWSAVANITFTQEDDISSGTDIRFMEADMPSGALGTTTPYTYGIPILEQEIYVNNDTSEFFEGEKAFTYLHELGHAIGLTHPYASALNADGQPYSLDFNQGTTVMSYREINNLFPTTPMIYDIQAIQSIYGANRSVETGFGGSSSSFSLDGSNKAWTLWDGGGVDDVLRVGATETRNATLDLRGGLDENGNVNWSRVGDEYVAIAFDAADTVSGTVTIENAIGGAGNDTFYGNYASNIFIGNSGADTINFIGAWGQDVVSEGEHIIINDAVLSGEAVDEDEDGTYTLSGYAIREESGLTITQGGNSIALTDWSATNDYGITLKAPEPDDERPADVAGENVTGDAPEIDENGMPIPTIRNDVLSGTSGDDNLYGGSGSDVLYGNGGNDVLYGNDNDALYGGSGWDTLNGSGTNSVLDGGTGNDFISAAYASTQLIGGAGSDWLIQTFDDTANDNHPMLRLARAA